MSMMAASDCINDTFSYLFDVNCSLVQTTEFNIIRLQIIYRFPLDKKIFTHILYVPITYWHGWIV